jgi:hypothetical protein
VLNPFFLDIGQNGLSLNVLKRMGYRQDIAGGSFTDLSDGGRVGEIQVQNEFGG